MTTKNETVMVQDKKTGVWFDPVEKFNELMEQDWFKAQMRRMKDEAWEEGMRDAFLFGQNPDE